MILLGNDEKFYLKYAKAFIIPPICPWMWDSMVFWNGFTVGMSFAVCRGCSFIVGDAAYILAIEGVGEDGVEIVADFVAVLLCFGFFGYFFVACWVCAFVICALN